MSRNQQGKWSSTRDYEQRVALGARCPTCGKVRFLTRDDAKKQARRMKGREGRLNAYRCGEFWHLGHLPDAVVRGEKTRDDLDRRTA